MYNGMVSPKYSGNKTSSPQEGEAKKSRFFTTWVDMATAAMLWHVPLYVFQRMYAQGHTPKPITCDGELLFRSEDLEESNFATLSILVERQHVAALLGLSVCDLDDQIQSKRIPSPIIRGSQQLWRRRDIEAQWTIRDGSKTT